MKICMTALVCCVAIMLLSGFGGASGISSVLRACGLALCLGGAAVLLGEAVEKISELSGLGDYSEYVSLMLRGLGICVLCRICSDICRESGQASLASAVETAGKLSLVLLALPIVSDILLFVGDLTEGL